MAQIVLRRSVFVKKTIGFSKPTVLLIATLGVAGVVEGEAAAAPPSSSYKLVFADEFTGTTLDMYKWNYNYSWGNQHNHSAYMSPSQVIVGNNVLNLQAINQRNPGATDFWHNEFGWQTVNYTSGAINSSGKFNFTYGYFEASIKQPSSLGSWPAFWMLKSGWPPEIDIMEFVHTNNSGSGNTRYRTIANYHYTNNSGANASYYKEHWQGADLTAGYHTYGLEWTASTMRFYLDGSVIHTINDANAIADASAMYLILNHAVGGWAGTPTASNYPSDMLVDYVKVWQLPSSTSATTTWLTNAASGSWDTAANWSVQVPKFEDVTAVFRNNNNAAVSVTWDNARVLGGLQLDSTSTSYTLGDGNAGLQFAKAASGAAGTIDVASTNTMPHTIVARVELYDSVVVTNNSASDLRFTGQIVGTGDLTLQGVGTILISNNNTYVGNTYIDDGAAGPAVVRVDRSRPFGSVGTVHIGQNGNATTARVEVLSNRDIPNNIVLYGRNNASVAIQNISETNTLSGTVSVNVGGANYILQSDSGLLHLSATATTAYPGVSLQSLATGSRTVTLQGAGNGQITGVIQNGSAGTFSITKLGTGTWTLAGSNTYTGPTTITAGTLNITGSHVGGGAYSVAAGAILAGTGLIDPANNSHLAIAGTLSPGGSGYGTLTVGSPGSSNNVSFSPGSELAIQLGVGGLSDLLYINGGLSLASDVKLRLQLDTTAFGGPAYTIARFDPGTLGSATFSEVYLNGTLLTSLPYVGAGYSLKYENAAGLISLSLNPIPEPSAALTLLPPLALLARRRSHR